jgi:hypothetical protein
VSIVTASVGGAWRRISSPWSGRVLAAADDGSTTFVLWIDASGRLQIGRRPHDGAACAPTQLSGQGANDADLVARAGRWWAVWSTSSCTSHMDGCSTVLRQAKSLGRGVRPESVLPKADPAGTLDVLPSLALRDDGAVLVFLRRDSQGDVIHYAVAGLDGRWTDSVFEPAAGAREFAPDVTVANGRVVVGWVRDGLPVVAMDDAAGHFTRYALPYRSETSEVRVAASAGRAFVGHHACFQYGGGFTCRTYVSTLTADGTVTGTTELSAGAGATTNWVLDELVAAHGTATAAVSTAGSLVSRSGF